MTENKQINGDLAVSGDAAIGGGLNVQGKSILKGNVRIEGWLDADNLRTPCKGLFADLDALKAKYPSPVDGWFAFVGENFPANVYAVENNEWVQKGNSGSVIVEGEGGSVDISRLESNVDVLHSRYNALEPRVTDVEKNVAFVSDKASTNESAIESFKSLLKILPLPFDMISSISEDTPIAGQIYDGNDAKIIFNNMTGRFIAYSEKNSRFYMGAKVMHGYNDPDVPIDFTNNGVLASPYRIYINRQNGMFYKVVKEGASGSRHLYIIK